MCTGPSKSSVDGGCAEAVVGCARRAPCAELRTRGVLSTLTVLTPVFDPLNYMQMTSREILNHWCGCCLGHFPFHRNDSLPTIIPAVIGDVRPRKKLLDEANANTDVKLNRLF